MEPPQGEDDDDAEDEEDAGDGQSVLRVVLVDLAVDGGLADERECCDVPITLMPVNWVKT